MAKGGWVFHYQALPTIIVSISTNESPTFSEVLLRTSQLKIVDVYGQELVKAHHVVACRPIVDRYEADTAAVGVAVLLPVCAAVGVPVQGFV